MSLAAGIGSTGVAVTIGVSVAINEIENDAYAGIVDGQNLTAGAVTVRSSQSATIDAVSVAASIGLGIGLGTGGIALSGAGAVATNTINNNSVATVSGSTVHSAGAVTVEALSTSTITAKIAALAVGLAFDPSAGIGVAIGVSVAINQIGDWTVPANPDDDPTLAPVFNAAGSGGVSATIVNSDVTAGGKLTVHAKAGQTIDALVISGSVALGAGTVGVGVAGAGVYTENRIGVLTEASVTGASAGDKATIVAASVEVSAEDGSHITANAGAAAVAAAIGAVGVSVSFGVAIAKNTIANDVDAHLDFADVSVTDIPIHDPTYQGLTDPHPGQETNRPSQAPAPGKISVSAKENATINAISAAAAIAISGGAVGVSVAGGGAVATNVILGATRAYALTSSLDAGGDITFSAGNTSEINATIVAAAVGVAIGGVAVGASLGFGVALNSIGYHVDGSRSAVEVSAYVSDSDVRTYGKLGVSAQSSQTIKANVAAASVAVSAGVYAFSAAGAGAVTLNRVGVVAHGFIDGGTVTAGDIAIAASDTSSIDAFAGAAAVALAFGFGGGSNSVALGVAYAENLIANDIAAYAADADITVTGRMPVQSNGYIYTVPGAGPTYLPRVMPAYQANSGSFSITAKENATLSSVALMASLAASTDFGVTVSGGGAVTKNTASSNTSVRISGGAVDVNGSLTMSARDVTSVVTEVDAISLAIGIFSLAAGGASAESYVTSGVSADITDTRITAGAVDVEAVMTPKARSQAAGVNAGVAAVGVSLAKAKVDTHVSARTSGTVFTVDSLRMAAAQTLPSTGDTANAKAQGLAGGLVGVDSTVTEAINTSTVVALLGAGTIVTAARGVSVAAQNDSRQRADSNSAAYGLVAAGVTKAKAQSLQHVENGVPVANTTAEVADNVVISAGAMSISALGSDDNQASSSPGSGGLVAGAAAIADTTSNAVTQAVLGDGAQVTLTKAATRLAGESAAAFAAYQATAGRFAMTSDHLARANTVIVTSAYGVLAGSGAEADNTISSTSNVIIGNNARVTAYAINATSLNRFDKPNIGDNVNGSTGGLFAGAGVTSDTHLTLNTTTLVNDYAQLKVIGTSIDAGEFTLAARNDITFYENVSYKGGGLGSGIGAESKLDADNVFATVQIGTDTASDNHVELNTVGQMDLRADAGANAEMHVSVDNYGGVTVSVADATIDLSPTNSILVGKGSHIKALSDVNMLAGMDTDNNHDVYRVAVYSDTFAGSVIPIDHVVADALLYQHNVITIAAGALVESGGNVRLFADDSPFADMMAQGKAVNWASSLVGAIDKALGGNAYAQTKGTAHSDTHGVVTVDGTVRTGLNRNINIVFDSTGDKDNLQIFYSGEGSDSVSMHVDESPLQSSYFDLIADAEEKKLEYSGNQDLIDFYDREIARMVSELEFLGLAEEVPVLNSDGTQTVIDGVPQFGWIPVKKNVLTIHVDPILASAGYIDIRADVLQGQGTLDAPGNVTVSIVNKTVAFLDIGGIYIPENNGGVFFNGFQNEISRINSDETDPAAVRALLNGVIADQNQANANDDNSDDQRGGEPVLVPGTVNLDITRTYDTAAKNTVLVKNTLNADLVGVPWPGITVSGDIDAITASVTLDNSVGSGDITITADIHSAALNVITGGMVIIDLPPGSVLNTGGDPYDAWKQITDPDGMGEASDTDRDAELAKAPTSGIYASLISINAEYVNLNGLIQSGSSDYVLNIGAATIAEIDQIKKDIASGKIQGGRVLLETVNYNEFKAYWDSDLGKIVIQEFRTPVGSITITGKLMNTGNGQIKALGAYVNVTVNNASDYDLLIRRIDVTERGLGTIILNDKSKRDDGGYTQTWYQTRLDGTVDVRVVDFKPADPNEGPLVVGNKPVATKKMVETGGVTSINVAGQHDGTWDYVATYNPQQGWRYGWSVATKTLESVTTTYGTSAWIGIDALARDPDNVVDTKYKLLEEPTLVPGSDYFYKSNVSDAYTHNSVTVVLSKTEPKLIDKWETSTWYGKTTYYQKYLVEQRLQETATNSIEADRPVQISFIGYEEATVKINSTGAGKVIIDNGIYNDTGLTQIVSNTTIEARNDNSVVQGVRITLDGNLGVGTGIRPLQIDLVDQYPVGYSRSTAYAYLTGHSANGDIYVKERYGDMSINTVVADKGNVTLTSHAGIVVADSAENTYLQGLVKGASITLVADTYVDAQGALPAGMQGGVGNSALRPLQLDSGDSNDDKVNISAEGDIFVSEIAGDLHLVRAVTHGNVWIEVRSGSLLDSDYVSVKDKRTYDELKAGVWTDLQLTGDTGAQDKINATLLGYESFAHFRLDDSMAKTPEAAMALLTSVWEPARSRALEERAALQALVREEGGNFELAAWDWRYRSRRGAAEALPAARQGDRCGLRHRFTPVRCPLQKARGYPGLSSGCARLRGDRRERRSGRPLPRRLFRPSVQAQRRLDERLSRPGKARRRHPADHRQCHEFREGRRRRADSALL